MDKICKIRWDKDNFSEVNMATKKLRDIADGVETIYDIGGGGYTEELLWENPDSTVEFTESSITTADISQYDYIKIAYKTTLTDASIELTSIYPTENVNDSTIIGAISYATTSKRSIGLADNTTIQISNATRWTSSGTLNNTVIPLAIYGLK